MTSQTRGLQGGLGGQKEILVNTMNSDHVRGTDGGLRNYYVYSLNVNGINDRLKRRMLFSDLKRFKRCIFCLQETHLQEAIIPILRTQWRQKLIVKGNSSQAGGLAILFSRDLEVEWEILNTDVMFRYVIVKIMYKQESFILVNIYCPTADKEGDQLDWLDRLEYALSPVMGEKIVLTGDFNVIMDPELESMNYVNLETRNARFKEELRLFLESHSLVDPWRIRNETKKIFSWTRGNKASRLDYTFVSSCLLGKVSRATYVNVAYSDHRASYIGFQTSEEKHGKGFWSQ